MAVNTASRRFSMMRLGRVGVGPLPPPDGAIDAGDRAHLLGLYSGIALDVASDYSDIVLIAVASGTSISLNAASSSTAVSLNSDPGATAITLN